MYPKTGLLLTCATLTFLAGPAWPQEVAAPAATAPSAAPPPAAPATAPPAAATPTAPQPAAVPTIGDQNTQAVASIVNDYVITDHDVNQRTLLYLATSGIRNASPEAVAQIRQAQLRALEDETLQLQEAARMKITVATADVNRAIDTVATDNNMTVQQLSATLAASGVSMTTLRSQMTATIAWQRLVGAMYAGRVNITDDEVDAAIARLKEGASKPQFHVGEIFLSVDNPQQEAQVKAEADQIAQQLTLGASFPNVARQLSRAPSAASGGNIGWVQEGQLPEALDKVLRDMRPGQVTAPIRAEGGYYLLMLADRREPAGTEEVQGPPPLDPNGPIPVDRILLPLAPGTTPEYRQQAMEFATNLAGVIQTCADITKMDLASQGIRHFRLGEIKVADLAPEFGTAIAKTPPGGVSAPIPSDAGIELFVRCDPAPRRIVAQTIPTRDEMRTSLLDQQLGVLARSYLRNLRRDGVVEAR